MSYANSNNERAFKLLKRKKKLWIVLIGFHHIYSYLLLKLKILLIIIFFNNNNPDNSKKKNDILCSNFPFNFSYTICWNCFVYLFVINTFHLRSSGIQICGLLRHSSDMQCEYNSELELWVKKRKKVIFYIHESVILIYEKCFYLIYLFFSASLIKKHAVIYIYCFFLSYSK